MRVFTQIYKQEVIPRCGFSIVELLIAVSIMGILAALVATNYSEQRIAARDANRKEAVRGYSHAMELYKSIAGNYFVYDSKKGSCTTSTVNLDFSAPAPNNYYVLHGDDIAGAENPACTGYKPLSYIAPSDGVAHHNSGGGQGRMTRRGIPNYSQTSIADALVDVGVLNKITLDPSVKGFTDNLTPYNDYTLVLCQDNGLEPQNASQATTYAIYTKLERPSNSTELATAHQSCGGTSSKFPRHTAQ